MSGSDTESADVSADTNGKRACKQISIYDKRTVCLDALVTVNNKKFTSRYKEGTFLREHDQMAKTPSPALLSILVEQLLDLILAGFQRLPRAQSTLQCQCMNTAARRTRTFAGGRMLFGLC